MGWAVVARGEQAVVVAMARVDPEQAVAAAAVGVVAVMAAVVKAEVARVVAAKVAVAMVAGSTQSRRQQVEQCFPTRE